MSTAGKVLSILVALMILVSIYLLSMASQLNRSWGRGIESVSSSIEETAAQIRQVQADAYRFEQQAIADRQSTDSRLRSLRIQLEDLDNRLSSLKEEQLRLALRSKDEQDLIASMQETIAGREQAKAELQAALNETNGLRDRLASENSDKLDRLASIREQLTNLVAENANLLRRVSDRDGESSDAENTD